MPSVRLGAGKRTVMTLKIICDDDHGGSVGGSIRIF